jgi:selenocysteine lyase/cysteine desulfurase
VDAVLQAIPWHPGDNIITGDAEFPTNISGPLRLADRGVETRVVAASGGFFDLDALDRLVDARTRLVIVSQVSFRTGFRVDIEAIASLAHDRGALLLVDATQAFGVVPVSLAPADFVVASTFKWALAIHGAAVFAVADTVRDLVPAAVGWRGIADLFEPNRDGRYTLWPDARRYEEGMPVYGAQYTLEASLALLESIGRDAIEATVAARVERVVAALAALGVATLVSPHARERAGIVVFEARDAEGIAEALASHDVFVWGREGRVRISPHLYTSDADLDVLIERLVDVDIGR